jgi:uncharacterized membrane protein
MNPDIPSSGKEVVDLASLFKRSWALFAQKPLEHVIVSLIVLVIGSVTLGVLIGPLSIGQIRMIEKQQRGEEISIQDAFSGFDSFAAAFLVTVIVVVCMSIGLLLLVLPGLFVFAAWGFSYYFIARDHASTTEALASSWNLLKTRTASVLLVLTLIMIVNLLAGTVVFAALLTAPLSVLFCTLAAQDMLLTGPQPIGGAATPYGSDRE